MNENGFSYVLKGFSNIVNCRMTPSTRMTLRGIAEPESSPSRAEFSNEGLLNAMKAMMEEVLTRMPVSEGQLVPPLSLAAFTARDSTHNFWSNNDAEAVEI